jgi:hypothetical protein
MDILKKLLLSKKERLIIHHRALVEQMPYSPNRKRCKIIQALKEKFMPENITIFLTNVLRTQLERNRQLNSLTHDKSNRCLTKLVLRHGSMENLYVLTHTLVPR